jgi:hypothetical protein
MLFVGRAQTQISERTMNAARWRLVVAAAGFLGWIGWLTYLAATTTHPLVLSRPQFLQADLWVIAKVDGDQDRPAGEAEVVEVFWSRDNKGRKLKHIGVSNLPELGNRNGWQGPGQYILPLKKVEGTAGESFAIVPIRRSPGYQGRSFQVRIYTDDSETRDQLANMRAGNWEK